MFLLPTPATLSLTFDSKETLIGTNLSQFLLQK